MKDGRTISIRFNGENKDRDPEVHKEESAAAEEKEFEWILPERRDEKKVVEFKKLQLPKKKYPQVEKSKKKHMLPLRRKKKKHLVSQNRSLTLHKSVVVSVASAVFIGVLFGFILLMVFSGDDLAPPVSSDAKESTEVTAVSTDTAELSLSLQVVQSGVYSTEESALEFQQRLKDNGFPAAIINSDNYYLMIGVSSTVEGQEALAGYFKSKGEDVYAKQWNVSAEGAVLSKEGVAHLTEGKAFIEELVSMDLNGLTDKELTADMLGDVEGRLSEWSQATPDIEALSKGDGEELVTSLTGAVAEMKEYTSNETISSLWVAQQHLLDALVSYQELVESLK
ncbi:hypothetical protein [Guptibacillus algicola]|uniref:hypothetical protein n=1 Tax=Guptibacillus algicola TaxID=225844 RepID=UPI001CD27DBE|nr:hypothetical protein [Alkalihalobacillus algicola]MCA0986218.1 hypothetical protein [Alkalihalobacillus algicola]